jgi:Transglycosylase SLT domain
MCSRRRVPIVAVCCLFGGGPMGSGAYANQTDLIATECERAALAAERAAGLPVGLLLAIGRVESGRWDDQHGHVAPWPWTINAAGAGQWFASRPAAIAAVVAAHESGIRSIDVGCFQISLLWHPSAFADLDEAFDPDANARYAARFMAELFARAGAWEAAVEAYHSSDPLLGFAYRQQVYASWASAPPVTMSATAGPVPRRAPAPVAMPVVYAGVAVWSPVSPGAAGESVAMPGAPTPVSPHPFQQALPAVSYHMPKDLIPRR